ncbi:RNA polymerase sigma factor [Demequina aestuarii]|uniref:RNA polymerase sigma factor n=1 Tax=Demequina aestuarii TaxID=327095 RepID=UPI000A5C65AA|nr:RNA polymerase sigma factor [Demequina aestuarii]
MTLGEFFPATLAAARQGATWAWENIYRDLYGPLHGFVRGSGVPGEAEDVVSETFLSIARDIHRFEGDEDRFRAWTFTIARRRIQDAWRSHGRTAPISDDVDPLTIADERFLGDVESEALSDLSLMELRAVIRGLTALQRDVLMLRVVADMSVKDTAEVLQKSEGAVRVLQNRAVRALREALGRGSSDESRKESGDDA